MYFERFERAVSFFFLSFLLHGTVATNTWTNEKHRGALGLSTEPTCLALHALQAARMPAFTSLEG